MSYFALNPYSPRTTAKKVIIVSGTLFFVFAGVAAYLLAALPNTPQAIAPRVVIPSSSSKMVSVLVPLKEVPEGAELHPHFFRIQQMPENLVEEGSVRELSLIKGKYAASRILRGRPLHKAYMSNVSSRAEHILPQIKPGYRAVAIPVNRSERLGVWATPGAFVDVFVYKVINGKGRLTPVVHAAEILAIDRKLDRTVKSGSPLPTTVTLQVTEPDARAIRIAEKIGSITLTLRPLDDERTVTNPNPMTEDDVLGTRKEKRETPTTGKVIINGELWHLTRQGKLISEQNRKDGYNPPSRDPFAMY